MLWNPATRQVRKLSSAPLQPESRSAGFGFGFDAAKQDFKVVELTCKDSKDELVLCPQVLDRRGGVWRGCGNEKRGFPVERVFAVTDYAVAANGALYWVAYLGIRRQVLSFDFRDETLRVADGPDDHFYDPNLWNGLLVAYTTEYDDYGHWMNVMWAATPSNSGLRWGKVMEFNELRREIWMDQFTAVIVKQSRNDYDKLFLEDFSVSPIRRRRYQLDYLLSKVDSICNYVESIVSVF